MFFNILQIYTSIETIEDVGNPPSDITTTEITINKMITEEHPIIDRYIWIKNNQDNIERFLTLEADGVVTLSKRGKYKVTAPTEPSASIRQMGSNFVLYLEDLSICSQGRNKPPKACSTGWTKDLRWSFIETEYGTLLMNAGMCLTKDMRIINGNGDDDYALQMMPCDFGIDQMFTMLITQDRNWQT